VVNRQPQVCGGRVEEDSELVVVAVGAQGPAEPGVVLIMPMRAGEIAAVRAAAIFSVAAGTARKNGLAAHPLGVDRAERRSGECGEHAWMPGHGAGYALAAEEVGADKLAGVTFVDR
jgi:hypothetical protein